MDTCTCDEATLARAVMQEVIIGNPSLNDLAFKFGKHRRKEIADIIAELKESGLVKE